MSRLSILGFRNHRLHVVFIFTSLIGLLISVTISVQAAPLLQNYVPMQRLAKSDWSDKLVEVALNGDGSHLAIAGVDKDVLIYDPISLTETNRLTGHSDETITVDWSLSGFLASGGKDKSVHIWDADFNPILTLPNHDDWVVAVAWSPNGKLLATLDEVTQLEYADGTYATKGTIRVWDISAGGRLLAAFSNIQDAVRSISWSSDSTKIAAAGNGQSYGISIWDVAKASLDRRIVGSGMEGRITSFAWSLDNTQFAVGSIEGHSQIWTASDGSLLAEWKQEKAISDLTWRTDGRVSIASYGSEILVWQPLADVMTTLAGGKSDDQYVSASWNNDGSLFVAGGYNGSVTVWNTSNLPEITGNLTITPYITAQPILVPTP